MLFIAERVAGRRVLQTDRSRNIAGINHFDILTVVGVHLHDAADTLGVVLRGVVNCGARRQRTGVHAEEAQLTDERVCRNLKRKRGKRLVIGGVTDIVLLRIGIHALDSRNVRRRGHIVHDRVQKFLNTLVFVGSTAGHRHHRVVDGRLADAVLDLIDRNVLAHEILIHDVVVLLGNMLDHFDVIFLGDLLHVLRDLFAADILAEIVVVDIGLHLHEVDDALKGVLAADRKLNRDSIALESVLHHLHDTVEVGAHDVHLVDIGHTRNLIFLSLTPNRFGLGLNAALRAENRDGAVEYAERTLNLDREVNVARCVNDIDAVLLAVSVRPEARRRSRCNRNAALLLLRHPVHRGGTIMCLTDLVVDARVVKDTLCRGCLTGIDVSHDADISC